MRMPIIEAYLDDLIKNSTLDVPAWNIEAARKGGKSGWMASQVRPSTAQAFSR